MYRIERFGEIDEDGIQVLLMLFALFLQLSERESHVSSTTA